MVGKIARLILRLCGAWPPGTVFCSAGNAGGVYVRQSTRLARICPSGRMVLTGGGSTFREHRINRYICDSDHNFFGYDLLFDSDGHGAVYRLAFEPLSVKPGQFLPAQHAAHLAAQHRVELPLEQLPPSQVLRLGHALEFSLATADGKYKVIERIKFSKSSGGSSRRPF
jgi:hypothetical protein